MLRLFNRDRNAAKKNTEEAVKPTRERWLGRVMGLLRSSSLDNSVWEELEEVLVSSDVGVETSLEIVDGLRKRAREARLDDPEQLFQALKESLVRDLDSGDAEGPWALDSEHTRPYVILMVGVNGVGKTTSIAKLAYHLQQAGQRVILGAADTFRAAGVEQLEILAQRVGVEIVGHGSGADPGAVAYDAYQAGKARGADVLIVDTAGRLHTKSNLMEELRKVRRVLNRQDQAAPHQVILTLDATTGHNGLAQAKSFQEAVGCTGIFLSKLDGTARGGIALAIKRELQVPILFIGTGERLEDMTAFDSREFIDALLAPVP